MILSIVMMVKNEQKYLDSTLKSLKPLMDKVNSELIILDTGSIDKTVDIAKKYTGNIYYEKWNDNFGEMRNVSISYSKGEWVLILDADEQLIEYEKIVEFFNTDLHTKYNCASIELKNFTSEEEDIYNRASILRLFKKDNDFRYEGAIHEQPIYKRPIYNNIAAFNHYGYIYTDEEVKQSKIKRNEKILLSEFKLKPTEPYINYQLAKNYTAYGDKEEALTYMERAYYIYKNLKSRYIPCETGLAKLYFELGKYIKCEHICKEYIEWDKNNIDIYCYLALSQKALKKNNESLKNYEQYLYLIENYDLSTQANNIYAMCDTFTFKENAKLDMINIFFEQEQYELVLENCKNLEYDFLKRAQIIMFNSLYKLDRFVEVIDMYNEISSSIADKNTFLYNLECFILTIKQTDINKIYMILSNMAGNYGILNSVRIGKTFDFKTIKSIITEEKNNYYADLIYSLFKEGYDLENILSDIDNVCIYNYFSYIVDFRKDIIVDLYNYLNNVKNTLDTNKLSIYSLLAKSLLNKGNLKNKKYENLYNMYIVYTYQYIKKIYKEDLRDEQLLNLVNTEEYRFVIEFVSVNKLKNANPLEYIKKMKKLAIQNKISQKGIELTIKRFEKSLNCNEELSNLKESYKLLIKKDIEKNELTYANQKIQEYEEIFGEESEILNLKGIIEMISSNFEKAESLFKKSYMIDMYNYDVIFNIACIKEIVGEYRESIDFLKYILSSCEEIGITSDANKKITYLYETYMRQDGEVM